MPAPPAHQTNKPWHREPWPWMIIGLLGLTVVAGLVTLWIAVTHPDQIVVDESEYHRIQSELRAQDLDGEATPHGTSDRDDGG